MRPKLIRGPWRQLCRSRRADACGFALQQAVYLNSDLLRTFLLMKTARPSIKEDIRRKGINF